jgi:hypothetical protein
VRGLFRIARLAYASTCECLLNREVSMLWTAYSTRATVVCLLALTLSGCGTIGWIVAGNIISSNERAEDDRFCEKRCADLKGDDYTRYRLCMSEERDRRIKDRGERDRKEMEKRLAEEALRTRSK